MGKKNRSLKRKLQSANRKIEELQSSMDDRGSSFGFPENTFSPSGGWANYQNDFGPSTDPTFATNFLPPYEFTFRELTDMYLNPLMYRIINLHAQDGTRKGFELVSKDNADFARDIKKEMDERFKWIAIGAKMIAIRHLYGGGVIFVDADDGRDPSEPLNEKAVRRIWSFRPIQQYYAIIHTTNPMLGDDKPEQPLHYRLTIQAYRNSTSFICHRSRIIRYPEYETDDVISQNERVRRRTWPFSTTQLVYDAIKRYGIGMQSGSQLLQSFIEDIFKVSDLGKYKDLNSLRNYIREQRLLRNSLRATIIGRDDEIQKLVTPTQGMGDITIDQRRDVGMVSGIPVPIVFSEESGALGGSTLSESRKVWFDSVESNQTNKYTPMYREMLRFASLEYGWDISNIDFSWNNLFTPTEFEMIEMRNKQSETDQRYWQMGLPEEDILRSRFGGEKVDLHSVDFDADQFEKDIEEMREAEKEQQEAMLNDLDNEE